MRNEWLLERGEFSDRGDVAYRMFGTQLRGLCAPRVGEVVDNYSYGACGRNVVFAL